MEEDNLLLLVATPFTIEGEFKGHLLWKSILKKLEKFLWMDMDSERLESYFYWKRLFHSVQHHVLIRKERECWKKPPLKKCWKMLFGRKISKEKSIYTDEKGTKVIGVHSYFPDTDWCLVSEIDADEAFSVLQNL